MASFCSLIGKCRDQLAGWSFGMADVNVGCGCVSLGTWSLRISKFLTGRWAWCSLVAWVTHETVDLFSFRSPLLGDVTSDLFQLMTSSMLAAVCLGLNEPWDHEMTAFFRFKPWCPFSLPPGRSEFREGGGRWDFSLWWRGDLCPEWDSLPTRVSGGGALIYRRAPSVFLDSSYE